MKTEKELMSQYKHALGCKIVESISQQKAQQNSRIKYGRRII